MSITPAQCRAARALLGLSQEALKEAAGLGSRATLVYFEKEERATSGETVSAIEKALVKAGIEFIAENGGGAGVRLRKRKK